MTVLGLVVLAGADKVVRVGDQGDLPQGIPLPALPDVKLLSFSMVTGALVILRLALMLIFAIWRKRIGVDLVIAPALLTLGARGELRRQRGKRTLRIAL